MKDGFWGVSALVIGCLSFGSASALDNLQFEVLGGGDLEDELRNSSLVVAAEADDVTDPQELLSAARADYGRLVGALYSEGHFGGVINILVDGREAADISPLAQLGAINTISVRVAPGPVYTFSQTRVAPLAPDTELPEEFAVGAPALTPLIEDAAGQAVTGWREAGHAKAEIAGQSVVAQHDVDRLSVDIGVAPGPLVRFGDLILRGSDAVRPERLRAIAGLPTGEVFDPEELQLSVDRLRRTQVFSSVALTEAKRLGPGNTLDIIGQFSAQPPRRFGFGAEVSSVDGVGLSSFWLHRNLLGGAERLRIEGAVSGIGGRTGGTDYSAGIRFDRPATFSANNDFYTEAQIARLNEPDYISNTGTIGAGITRYVSEYVELEYGLAYRFSRVEDENGTTDYSMLTLPIDATYDSRDVALDAKTGVYVALGFTPFLGLNEETGDGARATWDARTYFSFGETDRITLAGRLQGGSIIGADLDAVPNEYRFYSGGGGTVRGQQYQSLGVTLNGIDSGGGSFVGVSGEVRAGITDSIGLVAFYDYGIVGRDSFPDGSSDDQSGAGLGVRYVTPIGPIRLDVATPVSGDESSGVEVYVGIGQAF
ncbi:translocation and assembly module TamA [Palleronia aestuarii]|uniref:Translocation and assembly module TamA n=1 Tax=Palleronia aestuarii TaxID=568105 RepID=A0A2W7NQJ5_9RHOB|nr:autotransporter assembly complex family protein [Palleronia aestuarii]PZX18904.1 translocation and assembly module TamA [Palleronia aestuarii]